MTSKCPPVPVPPSGLAVPAKVAQINMQRGFGGGEVYTCFLGRAMRELGVEFDLVVQRDARWWRDHDTGATHIHAVKDHDDVADLPFVAGTWLIYHTPDGGERLARLKARGIRLASLVHMPLYQRRFAHFRDYELLVAVSGYVLSGLLENGLAQAHREPLYGVADLERSRRADESVIARSRYEWDTRKLRDRMLSWVHPIWQRIGPQQGFDRRPGPSLGVVSRLTPIKQFPALFAAIVPTLQRHTGVNIEIFGSGGYASVRDTRRQLAPLGNRVRWWGQQHNVRAVYPLFDFLLTGLPEKEALGLNVIEAQICGTPVLAPNAAPFTETIADGRSGYLYPDPRGDGAAGFEALLAKLLDGRLPRPDPRAAREHLARFSEPAFRSRVARLLHAMETM